MGRRQLDLLRYKYNLYARGGKMNPKFKKYNLNPIKPQIQNVSYPKRLVNSKESQQKKTLTPIYLPPLRYIYIYTLICYRIIVTSS